MTPGAGGVGRKVLGVAAGAAGVAVAGGAARAVHHRRSIVHREVAPDLPLGSLHSDPIHVVADDGVPLHAEIDPYDPEARPGGRRRRTTGEPPITVVFCHGYALNLDCWHFQRAAYRGLVRAVYYDQRSHGRSGRSPSEHATIDQLGRDLKRVLDDLTHDAPVVLVGHSMGGMTIMSLAEQHPELFGKKVVGAALIATTAGGLDPGRILFPMIPAGLGSGVMSRIVTALSRGHRAVDSIRTRGQDLAKVVADAYAFGANVDDATLDYVYRMLDRTPFEVVADFSPAFASLDSWDACGTMSQIPVSLMGGTSDKITAIGHARKLHARIQGSDLLECDGAGHMLMIERHAQVNAELNQLLAHALDRVERR